MQRHSITTPFMSRNYFFIVKLGRGWPGANTRNSAINYNVLSSRKILLAGSPTIAYIPACIVVYLKGIYTPVGSLTFSNSGLPDHHSPTL